MTIFDRVMVAILIVLFTAAGYAISYSVTSRDCEAQKQVLCTTVGIQAQLSGAPPAVAAWITRTCSAVAEEGEE